MHEAGIGVLEDVIDQFLHDSEDEQFLFGYESLAIVMESTAGIDGTCTTYFLEQVVNGRFQSEVFQRRRHQAVRDVPDKLYGIINDLLGVIDTL
jgi:hypothetical protein